MKKPFLINIEKIKDIILVVLFFITILLIYFFWRNNSFDIVFQLPSDPITSTMNYNTPPPSISQLIQPEEISVCFGSSGTYTKVSLEDRSNLWNSAINQLRQFGKSETVFVEEITKEKYEEILNYRSIEYRFAYDIPFSEFLKYEDIKKYQSLEGIFGMGSLAYFDGSKESIVIHQYKDDKYYRLASNNKEFSTFSDMIDEIESSDYITYYPSNIIFGLKTNSNTLIPLSIQSNLQPFPYQLENKHNKEKLKELSASFFGESYDFVRKMVDSKGAVINMYGYGQKVFTMNTDGSFEYKEEENESSGTSLGFYEALETAVKFVANRGGWQSLNGAELTPYLKDVIVTEKDKNKTYEFSFGMLLNGHKIYYQEGEPLFVEIKGSQVIRYKRNMIDFDNSMMNNLKNAVYQEVFPAVNVPAGANYIYLKNLLESQAAAEKVEEKNSHLKEMTFEQIAKEIEGMEVGYIRTMNEEDEFILRPAWIIEMKKMDAYFDLYNQAEPIGYSIK
ncbi:two-component system activity regulator YycH [Sinanaerobacter sp. ZZT-01]|uniref:two-component system activity regulator YycH n=1 Tax=Sinanaerobacter sp. ZZT-01 TaxID=3111540 RepID=UPI002D78FEE5|nr:two-component system activity regulator YycH [Sinanaerobacter sp. ZZT-01]WRR94748.1 two-component system activity regulator YycH [Sinanaerobacter sp. ZZT-01]